MFPISYFDIINWQEGHVPSDFGITLILHFGQIMIDTELLLSLFLMSVVVFVTFLFGRSSDSRECIVRSVTLLFRIRFLGARRCLIKVGFLGWCLEILAVLGGGCFINV